MPRGANDPDELYLYMKVARTEALGPGERFALWVQGCPFRCQGCLAQDSLPTEGGERHTVDAIAQEVLAGRAGLEGITISGGEPFLQAAALTRFVRQIRQTWDAGVIVYSGFTLQQLVKRSASPSGSSYQEFLSEIDLLIDGQYDERLNDGLSLRGSANQQVIPLTERYRDHLDQYGQQGRKVELIMKGRAFNLVGVPPVHLLERLHPHSTHHQERES